MTATDKSQLMRETRARRKKKGLVEFRVWCTPRGKRLHEALQADILKQKNREMK